MTMKYTDFVRCTTVTGTCILLCRNTNVEVPIDIVQRVEKYLSKVPRVILIDTERSSNNGYAIITASYIGPIHYIGEHVLIIKGQDELIGKSGVITYIGGNICRVQLEGLTCTIPLFLQYIQSAESYEVC